LSGVADSNFVSVDVSGVVSLIKSNVDCLVGDLGVERFCQVLILFIVVDMTLMS